MRFCPFCTAENADELAVCSACGRRLPPLPPRRARNAPPTGVHLAPRPTVMGMPPMRKPPTNPPPVAPVAPVAKAGSGAFDDDFNTVGASPAYDTVPTAVVPPAPPLRPGSISAQLAAQPSPRPSAQMPAVDKAPVLEPSRTGTIQLPPLGDRPPALPEVARTGTMQMPPLSQLPSPPPELALPRTGTMMGQPAPRPPTETPVEGRSGTMQLPPLSVPPARPARPSQPPPTRTSSQIPSVRGPGKTLPPPIVDAAPASPLPSTDTEPHGAQSGPRVRPSIPPPVSEPTLQGLPGQPSIPIPLPPPVPKPAVLPPPRPPTLPPAAAAVGLTPPPTRVLVSAERPFAPPTVAPIPEIPEPGLYGAARYAIRFGRARWQRRGAIKQLGLEIKQDTEALDQVLGALGKVARGVKLESRVFSAENAAISAVEERIVKLGQEGTEVEARVTDENSKFIDIERERTSKLGEAEKLVDEVGRELTGLETQRKNARDKRKELERRQKAYLKAAEDNDKQSSGAQMGDQRQELRRSAEQHRKEAAGLEPDRQEIDRRLAGLEKPIGEVTTKLDAAKAELDAAKRSLNDAREGHTHRLAELDAEQKRKSREISQAEGEITRRLVTLGTLVNLNRIEDPQFTELFDRIDRLRGAITARTTEIEKLAAEREAYDRGTLVRGIAAMGGAFVAFIALIVILRAIL